METYLENYNLDRNSQQIAQKKAAPQEVQQQDSMPFQVNFDFVDAQNQLLIPNEQSIQPDNCLVQTDSHYISHQFDYPQQVQNRDSGASIPHTASDFISDLGDDLFAEETYNQQQNYYHQNQQTPNMYLESEENWLGVGQKRRKIQEQHPIVSGVVASGPGSSTGYSTVQELQTVDQYDEFFSISGQSNSTASPSTGKVVLPQTTTSNRRNAKTTNKTRYGGDQQQIYHHQVGTNNTGAIIRGGSDPNEWSLQPITAAGDLNSSIDSAAELRRMKNKEAAIRSRQKKAMEQHNSSKRLDTILHENNLLKLDNAALRAENQVLKRQICFFENLFATKQQNQQQQSQQNSSNPQPFAKPFSDKNSQSSKKQPVLPNKTWQNNEMEDIIVVQKSNLSTNASSASGNNSFGQNSHKSAQKRQRSKALNGKEDQEALAEESSDVSFVLERAVGQGRPGGGMGMFGLATLMCICCITIQTQGITAGQSSDGSASASSSSVPTGSVIHGGSTLQEATVQGQSTEESQQSQQSYQEQTGPVASNQQLNQIWFLQVLQLFINSIMSNLTTLVTILAIVFMVALFPKDEIKEWAARKPFLRRFFDLRDVKIGAQTKYVKFDKLI